MPQIPSRLPREYESPSPDHRAWYTVIVGIVLRYSNVLHLHQRVCHKIGDTMVPTSRFTETVCFYLRRKEEEHPSRNHFSGTLLSSGTPTGNECWESKVVRCEKLKGEWDDEIKRAGLESLVPEEL